MNNAFSTKYKITNIANEFSGTNSSYITTSPSSFGESGIYNNPKMLDITSSNAIRESQLELIAKWFLNKSAMTHKKLQKLCYYAYCWYIVFFNDIEDVNRNGDDNINTICSEAFQAWIHGPVAPTLYQKYKIYGWSDIPKEENKPKFKDEVEDLLQQVWDAYGYLSADDLEAISHTEAPWINARNGLSNNIGCANEISKYDILVYFSKMLG